MRKHNQDKILEIQKLRTLGYSVPEISRKCFVPKTTVFSYVKSVKVKPEYLERLKNRQRTSKTRSLQRWIEASNKVDQSISELSDNSLMIAGAMLYWAEGTKRDFNFANTDPDMISLFLYILKLCFNIKKCDFKISVRIYDDMDEGKCCKFWSKITGVRSGEITVNRLLGKKDGKLKYGMCRVRIKKADRLHKEIFSIIDRIVYLTSPRSSGDRARHS